MKKILITGSNSMDGSHLVDILVDKNYELHCVINNNFSNLDNVKDKINIHKGNLTNKNFVYELVEKIQPDYIFHLAALSFSADYWNDPYESYQVNFMTSLNLLEAIKFFNKNIRFLNVSSSEVYGNFCGPINESSPMSPVSPYGLAKMCSQKNVEIYRVKYNLFASNAICFNHESERRPLKFVTRKLSSQLSKIMSKKQDKIIFGNIDIKKDWGYAPEYVDGMCRILFHSEPDDFILASNNLVSLKDIIIHAFKYVGIEDYFNYIEINDKSNNPNLIENHGIAQKAHQILDWKADTSIFNVIEKMIDHDIKYG